MIKYTDSGLPLTPLRSALMKLFISPTTVPLHQRKWWMEPVGSQIRLRSYLSLKEIYDIWKEVGEIPINIHLKFDIPFVCDEDVGIRQFICTSTTAVGINIKWVRFYFDGDSIVFISPPMSEGKYAVQRAVIKYLIAAQMRSNQIKTRNNYESKIALLKHLALEASATYSFFSSLIESMLEV